MEQYLELIRKESVVEPEDKEDAESNVSGFSFTEAVQDFSSYIKETRHPKWDDLYKKYENLQDDGVSVFSYGMSEDENTGNILYPSSDENTSNILYPFSDDKTEEKIHETRTSYQKPIRRKTRSNLDGSSLTKRSASNGSSTKSLNSRPKKKTKIDISGEDQVPDLVHTGQFRNLLQHMVKTELQKQKKKSQRNFTSRRMEKYSRSIGFKYFRPQKNVWSDNFRNWTLRKTNILSKSEMNSPITSSVQQKSELDQSELQINTDETNKRNDSHLYNITNLLIDVNKIDTEVSGNNETGIIDDKENQRPDTERSVSNKVDIVEEASESKDPITDYSTDNSKVSKSTAKEDDLQEKRIKNCREIINSPSRYNTRSSLLSSSLYNTKINIINKSLEPKTPIKEKKSESQSGNKPIELKSPKSQNESIDSKCKKSQNESTELKSIKSQNESLESKSNTTLNDSIALKSKKSQNHSTELKSNKTQNESIELQSKKPQNECLELKSNKMQYESIALKNKKSQNESIELKSNNIQNEFLELKSKNSQNESIELKSLRKESKLQTPKSIRMTYCTRSATKRNKENADPSISHINDVAPQKSVNTNIPSGTNILPSTYIPASTNTSSSTLIVKNGGTEKVLRICLTDCLASLKQNVPNVLSNHDRNSTNEQENIQTPQELAKFSPSMLMFISQKNLHEQHLTADMHYVKLQVKRDKSTGKFVAIMTRNGKNYLFRGNSAADINKAVQHAFKQLQTSPSLAGLAS